MQEHGISPGDFPDAATYKEKLIRWAGTGRTLANLPKLNKELVKKCHPPIPLANYCLWSLHCLSLGFDLVLCLNQSHASVDIHKYICNVYTCALHIKVRLNYSSHIWHLACTFSALPPTTPPSPVLHEVEQRYITHSSMLPCLVLCYPQARRLPRQRHTAPTSPARPWPAR